jgi:hypothetical protein
MIAIIVHQLKRKIFKDAKTRFSMSKKCKQHIFYQLTDNIIGMSSIDIMNICQRTYSDGDK